MRSGGASRRFDWRYELNGIYNGLDLDLQKQTGQIVPWYVYDAAATTVDSLYDTGSSDGGGRRWKYPINIPVLDSIKVEDTETPSQRGLYTVDTIKILVSPDALRLAGLWDIVENPNEHLVDRVVYENKVFGVSSIRVRGRLSGQYSYAMVAVEGQQVKREELVNDPDFRTFIPYDQDDDGSTYAPSITPL